MESFPLYLFSNSVNQPRNTLSSFNNILPETLILDNNWKVALEEIGFNSIQSIERNRTIPGFLILSIEDISNAEKLNELQEAGLKIYKRSTTTQGIELVKNHAFFPIYLSDDISTFNIVHQFKIALSQLFLTFGGNNIPRMPFDVKIEDEKIKFFHDRAEPPSFGVVVFIRSDISEEFHIPHIPNRGLNHYGTDYNCLGIFNRPDKWELSATEVYTSSNAKYVQVESNIIKSNAINNSYEKILRSFNVFKNQIHNEQKYFSHTFDNLKFHPLEHNEIKEIHIRLLDKYNKQLKLSAGRPTYIKLKFQKMLDKTFHVRLTSDPNKFYPNNEPYKFTVKLPGNLILDEKWRVGLYSFSSPVESFFSDQKMIIKVKVFKKGTNYDEINYELDKFLDLEEIVRQIHLFFIKNRIGSFVNLNKKININLKSACSVTIPYPLNQYLGLCTDLNSKEDLTVGAESYEETWSMSYIGKHFLDEVKNIWSLLNFGVYINIIEPVIINEKYGNLLKIVTVNESDFERKKIYKEFENISFESLQEKYVSQISVEIRSLSGNFIYFNKNEPVVLDLIFQKF